MKKKVFLTILFLALVNLFIFSEDSFKISYEQLSGSEMLVKFDISYYNFSSKFVDNELYSEIIFEGGVKTTKKGYAELPYIGTALQLPQDRDFTYEVVRADYEDYYLAYPLLPSKGELLRSQNPDEIPYTIDPASFNLTWYPQESVDLTAPFIFRDVRGTNIYLYPFQYNALKRMVRVYKSVQIRVTTDSAARSNAMPLSDAPISSEMSPIYSSLFINYNAPMQSENLRYANEIGEQGEILVIYTARDKTAIQPYIKWKREKGYKVHEREVAKGTNVESLVKNEYNANKSILYVQLVGDWEDIQSGTTVNTNKTCAVDPALGFVAGTDSYPDLIVGRFSAKTPADVSVQVNKTINYEKDALTTDTWYTSALGIASHEGAGIGDDNEIDYQHMDIIKKNKLLPSTYVEVVDAYKQPPTSVVTNALNKGVGLINYVGHGGETKWSTGKVTDTVVSGLNNGNKLPFIFSVACVVGRFNRTGGDCFAEVWLKKPNGGAVVGVFSTINQPWLPPMRGQDYMNDLLIGGYNYTANPGSGTSTTRGRTTFGSIAFNGMVLMYAETGKPAEQTLMSWTIFGDASLQVRTDKPAKINLSSTAVKPGQPYSTTVTDSTGKAISGMRVTLTQGTTSYTALTDGLGQVTLNHSFNSGSVILVASGFNRETKYLSLTVGGTGPGNLVPTADFSFTVNDLAVSFNDKSVDSDGRVVSYSWDFDDGTTSTASNPSHRYTNSGSYNVTLTVTDDKGATGTTAKQVNVMAGSSGTIVLTNGRPLSGISGAIGEWKMFKITVPAGAKNLLITSTGGSGDADLFVKFGKEPTKTVWDIKSVKTGNGESGAVAVPQAGDYFIGLNGYKQFDNLTLTAAYETGGSPVNLKPTADFSVVTKELVASFTDKSVDSDGQVVKWAWTFGDGKTSTGQNPVHTYAAAGTYTVELTVTDDKGATAVKSLPVKVTVITNPVNKKPVADFSVVTNELVATFSDKSVDSDGQVVKWAWTFGDGKTSTGQNPVHTYAAAGTYTVELTVTDDKGATAVKSLSVKVTVITNPVNKKPVADFSVVTNELVATFSDKSVDSDGQVVKWAWTFGDGKTSTGQNPVHTYAAAGSYTVELTVTDDKGATALKSISVTVESGGTGGAPAWAPGVAYKTGDLVTFSGATYKCTIGHTSLAGWTPAAVPALWAKQ